jgi:hypothetical protein
VISNSRIDLVKKAQKIIVLFNILYLITPASKGKRLNENFFKTASKLVIANS